MLLVFQAAMDNAKAASIIAIAVNNTGEAKAAAILAAITDNAKAAAIIAAIAVNNTGEAKAAAILASMDNANAVAILALFTNTTEQVQKATAIIGAIAAVDDTGKFKAAAILVAMTNNNVNVSFVAANQNFLPLKGYSNIGGVITVKPTITTSGTQSTNPFTLNGEAPPNSTVKVYNNNTLMTIPTVTADDNGVWAAQISNYQNGTQFVFKVEVDDHTSEVVSISINNPATGLPIIKVVGVDQGVSAFMVGEMLEATIDNIQDIDGTPDKHPDNNNYEYKWARVDANGNTTSLTDFTNNNKYEVVEAEGHKIKVDVRFQDTKEHKKHASVPTTTTISTHWLSCFNNRSGNIQI